jgi:hypothetical protein
MVIAFERLSGCFHLISLSNTHKNHSIQCMMTFENSIESPNHNRLNLVDNHRNPGIISPQNFFALNILQNYVTDRKEKEPFKIPLA